MQPRLAVIVNALTPYRVHYQTRIAREIPEFSLSTLLSWDPSRTLWQYSGLPEIGMVCFPGARSGNEPRTASYHLENWKTGRHITQWLRQHRPAAVVICGWFNPHFRAISWCQSQDVPYFIWGDSNPAADFARGIKLLAKQRFTRWVAHRAAGALACGTRGVEFFSSYGFPKDRIFISPLEPDYALIESASPSTIDAVQTKFSLPRDRLRFLVCARLIPEKALDLAIQAFATIAHERPDWDLFIVGDGPLRASLESLVPASLRDRITFTGFIHQQETVAALQRLSHVLLHPAVRENWGLAILEAAAAGLAIVSTTTVGAAPDLVRDGVNGRLVPPSDLPALIAALREVTDPARLAAMQTASRARSQEFRRDSDPIRGLRAALGSIGLLSRSNHKT